MDKKDVLKAIMNVKKYAKNLKVNSILKIEKRHHEIDKYRLRF
jgi:hypothetical protein